LRTWENYQLDKLIDQTSRSEIGNEKGKGVTVEQMKHALVLYQRSANQGYVDSRVRVGDLYYYGYGWGVGSNPPLLNDTTTTDATEKLMTRASNYIRRYFYPTLKPDYKSSVNHYLAAAEGDVGLSSVAMFYLGFMYQNGLGIEQVFFVNVGLLFGETVL
jgi:TPR repeat protein